MTIYNIIYPMLYMTLLNYNIIIASFIPGSPLVIILTFELTRVQGQRSNIKTYNVNII